MNAHELQATLPKIAALDDDLNPTTVAVHSFIRKGDTVLRVSAEDGDGAAEYYGPNGYPYIAPELEAWAKEHGGFWEWENPGCIAFYA